MAAIAAIGALVGHAGGEQPSYQGSFASTSSGVPLPANCFDCFPQRDDFIVVFARTRDAGGVGFEGTAGKPDGVHVLPDLLNAIEFRRC